MSPAKSSATARLAALEAAVGQARHHVRLADDRVQADERELDELADQIADSYSRGDDAAAREARELADRATADLAEAKDRLAGARRAVTTADQAADAFAVEHGSELVRERDQVHAQIDREADRIIGELVAVGARAREEQALTQRIFRRTRRNDLRVRELDAGTQDLIRQARRRHVDAPAPAVAERVPA